jgi:hypothetical protein
VARNQRERRAALSVRRILWGALALVAGALVVLRAVPEPQRDRDWVAPHARQATASILGDEVVIRDVRNFRYDAAGTPLAQNWEERRYDLKRLNSAWLGVSSFGSIPGVGHVFASFGFDDGRYLAVSIEARRERDEDYGLVKGAFRQYEIVYVLADERDAIGLRTNALGQPLQLYPVRSEPAALRATFVDILARANTLAEQPEFYDTLSNSCSINLARHVNRVAPGRVPGGFKLLFAALSDALAHEAGLLDVEGPLDEARVRYRVNERAAGDVDAGDFSARIRAVAPNRPATRSPS